MQPPGCLSSPPSPLAAGGELIGCRRRRSPPDTACPTLRIQYPVPTGSNVAMNFNKGPFGGHHLGGDSCPPITFKVVPY